MAASESPIRYPAVRWWFLPLAALAVASVLAADRPAARAGETVAPRSYASPAGELDEAQRALFVQGEAEFNQRWVVPFHVGGHWGRGPLSNGEACSDCHAGNGRGRAPDHAGMPMQSMLVRLSIAGAGPEGGPLPHPIYGMQLQSMGVLGKVPEEGRARLRYSEQTVRLADGETISLRKPEIELQSLRYGPIEPEALLSARVAQPVLGMGLLEAIPEATLLALAAEQRRTGLNGRPNRVFDIEQQRPVIGRFGHKANQPSLRQQVATALIEDLGITSRLFAHENCTRAQIACGKVPSVGTLELSDSRFDALLFYLRALAPPERRNAGEQNVLHGERLFAQARCAQCHVPELKTGTAPLPALAHRTIRPYTDLLLHDMGEGLADGRQDFGAGARDWRTPPLWGLRSGEASNGNATYLHDGRARNLTEAILWHGGEAQDARDAFVSMGRRDREALLAFLRSL